MKYKTEVRNAYGGNWARKLRYEGIFINLSTWVEIISWRKEENSSFAIVARLRKKKYGTHEWYERRVML